MAKKKSKKKQEKIDDFSEFDPRAMEKLLSEMNRALEDKDFNSDKEAEQFMEEFLVSKERKISAPEKPLNQAQELIYQTWESDREEKVRLAYRALEISKDCADAYIILAEEVARNRKEMLRYYQQAVEAGKRALGPEIFKEDSGHFWGLISTRPYMRALAGLAQCYWLLGKRREAIEHYYELLRLNPNDNQGIRYLLLNALLVARRNDDAQKLLNKYKKDPTATWLYSTALLEFRRQGASKKANSLLKKAIEFNPFVPEYLLKKKRFPREFPVAIGFGDDSEAVDYAYDAIPAWEKTPGALKWLKEKFQEFVDKQDN